MAWGLKLRSAMVVLGSRLRSALTYGLKAKVCFTLAARLKEGNGRL
jgi:hypothetical protein